MTAPSAVPAPSEEVVLAALDGVLDPEFPISVIDMGLIRGVEIEDSVVSVRLTYTSMGCPCTEIIQEDIEKCLLGLDGVAEVKIEETYEPWNRSDISHRGLKKLRTLGIQ
jgi:metal-sulfur cluster biosynthetic enzyme